MKKAFISFSICLFAVIGVAVFDFAVGWCDQGTQQTVNGNNNNTAWRDLTVYKHTVVIQGQTNKQYVEFRKIILKEDWEASKDNPAFRKLVRFCNNGKNVEQLDKYSKATFWEDISKKLDQLEIAEANYQQNKLGIVSEDLKALIPQIDKAREDFNYQEVNRLMQEFEEIHSGLVSDTAKFFYLKAQNFEFQINYPEAERYYRKAAAIEDQDTFYINSHALILNQIGKYVEAEKLFRLLLQIFEKQSGGVNQSVATGLHNLATALDNQGKKLEAEQCFRRSIEMFIKQKGSEDSSVATAMTNLAGLLSRQGKFFESEELFRQALQIFEKQLGSEHSFVALNLLGWSTSLQAQGKYAEAVPLLRRALNIAEKTWGKDHPTTVQIRNNLHSQPK